MIHAEAQQLLAAGAALDDLSADEAAAWADHRFGCAACAVLEEDLALVLADLALVAPERLPPPDLLAGIRLAIDGEDGVVPRLHVAREPAPIDAPGAPGAASAPDERVRRETRTDPMTSAPLALARAGRRPLAGALALAAALAIVAVGLGARTTALQDQLDAANAQVSSLRAEMATQGGVMAAAMHPGHRTVTLTAESVAPAATAILVYVPGTRSAYLIAEHLPPTTAGHGYQLWYADDAGVHALQTVGYDGAGAFVAPLDVDLARGTAVMVTLEDAGGATGDPGPQVVFGEL